MYVPCQVDKWALATNTFDFRQRDRISTPLRVYGGDKWRKINGHQQDQPRCHILEMGDDAVTQFQYLDEHNRTTPYSIYTPKTPFGPDAVGHLWRVPVRGEHGRTQPWADSVDRDRQVALAEYVSVTQGVYVCANGGNCSSPDVCSCAPGWIGFDCRTPVCEQGYYEPYQLQFTQPDTFGEFRGDPNLKAHPRQPDSNPAYRMEDVNITYTDVTVINRTYGDIRYMHEGPNMTSGVKQKWTGQSGLIEMMDRMSIIRYAAGYDPPFHQVENIFPNLYQGGYSCSIRSITHWERPQTLGTFPRCRDSDQNDSPQKAFDQVSGHTGGLVYDTDASFRARLVYDYGKVHAAQVSAGSGAKDGRWFQEGGECVDEVIRGCYNNGTCVAPNTCRCADGWMGFDCSVPVCHQECQHNGNCTQPDTCTCERGWTGKACEIAMCAQDCNNGGECIAPDVCKCKTWPTKFRDSRAGGGRPLFQMQNGDPMLTGWTGYDCNTPICVQAEKFILNVAPAAVGAAVLKSRAKWDIGCSDRFSCAVDMPLEERVKAYVANLCYSTDPKKCAPPRASPDPATCGAGLDYCVLQCLARPDIQCGVLCSEFDLANELCDP
eukprot:g7042.t1